MKTNLIRLFALTLLLSAQFSAFAQSKMEESFHANGSIRVVVAVSVIVMTGLLFFVLRMDRRVRKLEEQKRQSQ